MITRVVLRPIGSPVPLGLAGLAGASLVTSGFELGWVAASESSQVALILLAFAFPLQILASVFAFLARDGAVATTLGVIAATWLCDALVHLSLPPGTRSGPFGLLLLTSAGLVAAGSFVTASGKLAPAAVFGVAATRFLLLGIYNLGGSAPWQDAGGGVGLAVVVVAGYATLALALEDAHGRTVLPVGRRGGGATAMEAEFGAEVQHVEHAPGVRNQL